jgi:hypothetical protein
MIPESGPRERFHRDDLVSGYSNVHSGDYRHTLRHGIPAFPDLHGESVSPRLSATAASDRRTPAMEKKELAHSTGVRVPEPGVAMEVVRTPGVKEREPKPVAEHTPDVRAEPQEAPEPRQVAEHTPDVQAEPQEAPEPRQVAEHTPDVRAESQEGNRPDA